MTRVIRANTVHPKIRPLTIRQPQNFRLQSRRLLGINDIRRPQPLRQSQSRLRNVHCNDPWNTQILRGHQRRQPHATQAHNHHRIIRLWAQHVQHRPGTGLEPAPASRVHRRLFGVAVEFHRYAAGLHHAHARESALPKKLTSDPSPFLSALAFQPRRRAPVRGPARAHMQLRAPVAGGRVAAPALLAVHAGVEGGQDEVSHLQVWVGGGCRGPKGADVAAAFVAQDRGELEGGDGAGADDEVLRFAWRE